MMVRAMHAVGLEVILDVVYNHTAEGNQMGPTLSMRGVDNAAYYRLAPDPRYYMDFTGTGNTLNMTNPYVLQLIMDSLRYWVLEMHVDGFRFDLASTLARELFDVDRLGAFFDIIHQDPMLSQVKLIAEPWDVGPGRLPGRQLPGALDRVERQVPRLRARASGRGTAAPRRSWRRACPAAATSTRTTAASRTPASTSSPATTASRSHDLVSFNDKHNEANGEDNRDGANDNNSWNCGAEGATDDPAIIALRERQKRNLMATLMLSVGVPMMLGGDELGHGQNGNNNTYCQDNELTWLDWELVERERRVPRVHPEADLDQEEPAGLPAPQVLPGPGDPRLGRQGHFVPDPCGRRDVRRRLERRIRPVPGATPGRRPDQRRERARRADRGRDPAAAAQRPLGADRVHAARDQARTRLGPALRHGRPAARVSAVSRGAKYSLKDRSMVLLVTRPPEEASLSAAAAKGAVPPERSQTEVRRPMRQVDIRSQRCSGEPAIASRDESDREFDMTPTTSCSQLH